MTPAKPVWFESLLSSSIKSSVSTELLTLCPLNNFNVYIDYRGFPIKEQIRSTSDLSLLYDEEVARNSKISLTETQGNAQNSRYSSIKINTKLEKKQMKGSPRKDSPEKGSSSVT